MTKNPFCECERDGWCERYGREMGGRMRELCAGINVDLGTAAAFRQQWMSEAVAIGKAGATYKPVPLLLKTDQAPGDAVAMTAAIYSLHKEHPGKYITAVESLWPDVFTYNPNVVRAESIPEAQPLQMHYPAIHNSNERGIHFMQGWCEFLGAALGISVPLLTNRPRLYFNRPAPQDDFWIVCSGGKEDFTSKLWGHHNYQWVINSLPEITFIQVGGKDHNHVPLDGVVSSLGRTSLRQLFDLVRRARGVLCGVSLLMHVAAALEKPAIVIAGGREPVQWNAYPKQHYLHTVGALPCKSIQGTIGEACWRMRTVPIGDGSAADINPCERPVSIGYARTPECMTMIHPDEVRTLIMKYNRQYELVKEVAQ